MLWFCQPRVNAMPDSECSTLYHLVQATIWYDVKEKGEDYFPPTYAQARTFSVRRPPSYNIRQLAHLSRSTRAQDGFIHLTAEPSALLGVANFFYTGVSLCTSQPNPPCCSV